MPHMIFPMFPPSGPSPPERQPQAELLSQWASSMELAALQLTIRFFLYVLVPQKGPAHFLPLKKEVMRPKKSLSTLNLFISTFVFLECLRRLRLACPPFPIFPHLLLLAMSFRIDTFKKTPYPVKRPTASFLDPKYLTFFSLDSIFGHFH